VSEDGKAEAKQGGGLLRRLIGLGGHDTMGTRAHSGSGAKTTLDLGDIQGFICAATECRWCGISC